MANNDSFKYYNICKINWSIKNIYGNTRISDYYNKLIYIYIENMLDILLSVFLILEENNYNENNYIY